MSRGGEPAFPTQALDGGRGEVVGPYSGQTLLEHYAGQALQGYLSGRTTQTDTNRHQVARTCFDYAAAMVAEAERRRFG